MTLSVADSLKFSWNRLFTPVGGTLVAVTTGFYVVLSVIYASLLTGAPNAVRAEMGALLAPFAVSLGPLLLLVLFLLIPLASVVLWIVMVRSLATDRTDTLPGEAYSRRMGFAVLSMIAGGIATVLLMAGGFLLLVIPGIFISVSLSLFGVFVAVEDDGPVAAMKHSWGLVKGNRVTLFVLLIIVSVIVRVVSFVGDLLATLAPVVGWVVAMVAFGAGWVFYAGVLVSAYRQLKADDGGKYGLASEQGAEGGSPKSATA